eukprot:2933426-Rhodomonas_salina.4
MPQGIAFWRFASSFSQFASPIVASSALNVQQLNTTTPLLVLSKPSFVKKPRTDISCTSQWEASETGSKRHAAHRKPTRKPEMSSWLFAAVSSCCVASAATCALLAAVIADTPNKVRGRRNLAT